MLKLLPLSCVDIYFLFSPPWVEAALLAVCTLQFLSKNKHYMVVIALTKEVVLNFIYTCCQDFYLIMRLVRLADSKIPKYALSQVLCHASRSDG